MDLLVQLKKLSIGTLIASLVVGILFVAFPDKCKNVMALFVGGALIVIGLIGIVNYLLDRASVVSLTLGIITVISGIVFCIKYIAIISVIVALIGVFMICAGLVNIVAAVKSILSDISLKWVSLVLSVVMIVLGIIFITRSSDASDEIVRFIGIALLLYAVLDVITFIQVKRLFKKVKETRALEETNGEKVTEVEFTSAD